MNYETIAPAQRGPLSDAEADRMARQVHQHPDYRVLRRIDEPHASGTMEMHPGGRRIAILDTETTGLNPAADSIIELAIMIVTIDATGTVLGYEAPVGWLEQPMFGLDPLITKITGITDEMLEGQRIDRDAVLAMLSDVELIIAHNASFDLTFVEQLFPELEGRAWACSCREVPWADLDFEGRALSWLLAQAGLFNDAHRAAADVWSLFTLLCQPVDLSGRTILQLLLDAAARRTYRVEATGSKIEYKDYLKRHRYAWDGIRKVWHITVDGSGLSHQRDILEPIGVTEPRIIEQTARERHRS